MTAKNAGGKKRFYNSMMLHGGLVKENTLTSSGANILNNANAKEK